MVDSGRRSPGRRTSGLRCERCGVRYAEGAIARESTLLPGARCRRCGGTLAPIPGVAPVQSAVTGVDRVPFG